VTEHRAAVPSSRRAQRGHSLMETLVALVVLSVGLLGIAALQLTSLKANHDAASRSQATFLAYDIIDRMRANRAAALTGAYNIAIGQAAAGGTVAGNDLVQWKQDIVNTLPLGAIAPDGAVALNPATNIVTVTIEWDDAHGDPALAGAGAQANPTSDPVSFTTSTQLVN
jgi:type IV pilus assembly protein PilV